MSEAEDHYAIRSELSRKALEVIERRVHECQVEGQFSPETLKLICASVYDCVSGLVPWDVADLINTAIKELGK